MCVTGEAVLKIADGKTSLRVILANTQGSREISECKVPSAPHAFEE